MAHPYHLYRLSDCMERIIRSTEPVLVTCCNNDCHSNNDGCPHEKLFAELGDLPVAFVTVNHRDLPDILMMHTGLNWGHALLMFHGRAVRHWQYIPTRTQLDAALESLVELQVR